MSTKVPVGGWTGWQGFALWKDKVDNELVEIRNRIDTLAIAINGMPTGGASTGPSGPSGGSGSGGPTKSNSEFGSDSDFSSVSAYNDKLKAIEEYSKVMGKLTDIEGEDEGSNSLEGLINATYAFHEATHAMRGYLMLVDQMGLGKDQKKMVRDLEYIMMAIMKMATAIGMVGQMIAGTMQPELLPIFLIGGLMSAYVGYSSKVVGSGV